MRVGRRRFLPASRRAFFAGAVVLVVLSAAGFGASRWMPRPVTPPTDQMRAAMAALVATSGSIPPEPVAPVHPTTERGRLMAAAFALRGMPYKFGAKGPNAFDCSGFTKAAYAKIGVSLLDGSFNQNAHEMPLSDPAAMVPGDLIFYRWAGSDEASHVTMYAGDGWVIGTGSPGQVPAVTVYPLADDLIPDGRVITYRHIVLSDESPGGSSSR